MCVCVYVCMCVCVYVCMQSVGTGRDNTQPGGPAACGRVQVLPSTDTSHPDVILTGAQTVRGVEGGESDRASRPPWHIEAMKVHHPQKGQNHTPSTRLRLPG